MEDGQDEDLAGVGNLPDMEGDEDTSMDDGKTEFPDTGTAGHADGSGVSAGLISLLIALSVAAAVGLGLRRVRNRATGQPCPKQRGGANRPRPISLSDS